MAVTRQLGLILAHLMRSGIRVFLLEKYRYNVAVNKSTEWQFAFEAEIAGAERARQQGNEGKARVCARRAAGIVIGEFYRRRGITLSSVSAYDLLQLAASSADLPPQAAELCGHLLERLTPEFTLPVPVDLVSDARMLKSMLLDPTV